MSNLDEVFTAEMKTAYLEHETELITFFINNGFVSDALLDKYLPPSRFSLDDAALRSQRMVILTHLETRRRVLERRDAPRLRKAQKEKERREANEKKEKEAKVASVVFYVYKYVRVTGGKRKARDEAQRAQ